MKKLFPIFVLSLIALASVANADGPSREHHRLYLWTCSDVRHFEGLRDAGYSATVYSDLGPDDRTQLWVDLREIWIGGSRSVILSQVEDVTSDAMGAPKHYVSQSQAEKDKLDLKIRATVAPQHGGAPSTLEWMGSVGPSTPAFSKKTADLICFQAK